ncbi:MAG: hypothetical protein MPJ82_01260, partial [Alphaproteobacteria bacterium]|nr:hypothetical protein [Alphaproteobacteria bacterium]
MLPVTGTTHTLAVALTSDEVVEPDETFVVTISAAGADTNTPAPYTVTGETSAVVTVKDDDTVTLVSLEADPGGATGPTASLGFNLKASLSADIQYDGSGDIIFYEGAGTATGTALSFNDDDNDGVISGAERTADVISNGVAREYVVHTVGTESYTFREPTSAESAYDTASGLVDGDFVAHGDLEIEVKPKPVVQFVSADSDDNEVNEGGADNGIALALDKAVVGDTPLTFDIGVTASTTDSDATRDVDFTVIPSVVIVPADLKAPKIEIPITDDDVLEPREEFFTVTLTANPASPYALGDTVTATVQLTDNDSITIDLITTDPSPPAADTVFTISGRLSRDVQWLTPNHPQRDNFSVAFFQGGADDDIFTLPNINFFDKDGDGFIRGAERNAVVTIELASASRDPEPLEYTRALGSHQILFRPPPDSDIWIAAESGLIASQFAAATHTVTTVPDTDPPVLQFAGADVNRGVAETPASLVLTVTTNKDIGEATSVNVAVAPTGEPGDFPAAEGEDYTAPAATLALPATGRRHTISIPILAESEIEPEETFRVTLTAPADAPYTLGSRATSTVVIADSGFGELELVETTPAALTSGVSYTMKARLSRDIQYAGGQPIVFFEGAAEVISFSFPDTDGNGVIEGDEREALAMSAGAVHNFTAPSAAGPITWNFRRPVFTPSPDPTSGLATGRFRDSVIALAVPVTLTTSGDLTIEEGETGDITLTLSEAFTEEVTGTVFVGVGTASLTDRARTGSEVFNIPAGQTTTTFTVQTVEDVLFERDETFPITFTATNVGVTSPPAVTVTIDDDDEPPSLRFAGVTGRAAAFEDVAATAVIESAGKGLGFDTPVVLTLAGVEATAGDDYGAAPSFVLPEGATARETLTIPVVDDTVIEEDEAFTITIAPSAADPREYNVVAPSLFTYTIRDNDNAAAELRLSLVAGDGTALTAPVRPETSVRVRASLADGDGAPLTADRDITVTLSALDSDDWGEDTTAPADAFTISAGQGSADSAAFTLMHENAATGATLTATFSPDIDEFTSADDVVDASIDLDEPLVVLTLDTTTATAAEGGTAMLTVSISPAMREASSVDVVLTPVSAEAADYGAVTTLALPNAATSAILTLTAVDDSIVETPETFTVTFSPIASAPYDFPGVKEATVTITDTDTAALTLSTVPATPVNDEPFAIQGVLDEDIEIPSVAAGVSPSVLAFTDSGTGLTLTFTDKDRNGILENDELTTTSGQHTPANNNDIAFDFNLDPAPQHGLAANKFDGGTATVSFTQRDMTLAVDTINVNEGDAATVTVTFTPATTTDVSFRVSTRNDQSASTVNAVSGTDFTAPSSPVTVPAGTASHDVLIQTTENTIDAPDKVFIAFIQGEPNQPYRLVKTSVNPARPGASARVTIVDDDDPRPSVSLASATATAEEGDSVTLTVNISPALTAASSVNVALAPVAPAVAADFGSVSSPLALPANATTATITITTAEDAVVEPDEEFTVTLSSISSAPYNLGGTSVATVTIENDDQSKLTLTATPDPAIAGDEVVLRGVLSGQVQVPNDGSIDFTDASGAASLTLTFLDANSDGVINGPELTRNNASVTPGAAEKTLVLDYSLAAAHGLDPADFTEGGLTVSLTPRTVEIDAASQAITVTEGSPAVVNLKISHALVDDSSFDIAYEDTDADGDTAATPGADFVNTATSLVLPKGVTTFQFQVNTTDDTADEADSETFVIVLSPPTGAPYVFTPTSVDDAAEASIVVTVSDNDDPPPAPTVRFDSDTSAITEGDTGSQRHQMALSASSFFTAETFVAYAYTGGTATGGAGAVAGNDYDTQTTMLSYPLNQENAQVRLTVYGDTVIEGDETVTVTLSDGAGYAVNRDEDDNTVTIRDNDDDSAKLRLLLVDSGGTTVTSAAPGETVKVRADLIDGDDDSVLTADEDIVVTLSALGSAWGGTTAPAASFTISAGQSTADSAEFTLAHTAAADDATVTATFTPDIGDFTSAADVTPATVDLVTRTLQFAADDVTTSFAEGDDDGTLTFMLESPVPLGAGQTVTVRVESSATLFQIPATAGSDYIVPAASLSLDATATTQPLRITIRGDQIVEAGEQFRVTLSAPTGASYAIGGNFRSTVTLTDDDFASLQVTTEPSGEAFVGEPITVTGVLNAEVQFPPRTGPSVASRLTFRDATTGAVLAFEDAGGLDGLISGAELTTTTTYTPSAAGALNLAYTLTPEKQNKLTRGKFNGGVAPAITVNPERALLFFEDAFGAEGDTVDVTIRASREIPGAADFTGTLQQQGGNTATLNTDFTIAGTTFTIADGATSTTVRFVLTTDGFAEGSEFTRWFINTLNAAQARRAIVVKPVSELTISDPPRAGFSLLSLPETATIAENAAAGEVSLTVTASPAAPARYTGKYRVISGTAVRGDPDDTAADFVNEAGSDREFTIARDGTSDTFTVPINDDSLIEGDETFNIYLRSPRSAADSRRFGIAAGATLVTIQDDEDDDARMTLSLVDALTGADLDPEKLKNGAVVKVKAVIHKDGAPATRYRVSEAVTVTVSDLDADKWGATETPKPFKVPAFASEGLSEPFTLRHTGSVSDAVLSATFTPAIGAFSAATALPSGGQVIDLA